MIRIDGSQGEGGGQILRSSLALAMITGKPFTIHNIRAGRKKPGLMRQHLTAVKAASAICNARTDGASMRSTKVTFIPGEIRPGEYRFAVGTAGSTTLILQTILPALLGATGPSEIVLEGGTHNPLAPPFDFLKLAFIPLLEKMGCKIGIELQKTGFYPAGGGRIVLRVVSAAKLHSLEILDRGATRSRTAIAMLNRLPETVGKRELEIARKRLNLKESELVLDRRDDAERTGNIFLIQLAYKNICEVFCGFGEKGVPAERVANSAVDQVERYLKSDAPVGDYLADQLLLPFALAGKGAFRTIALSRHFHTNKEVIQQFIEVEIRCTRTHRLSWLVEIG